MAFYVVGGRAFGLHDVVTKAFSDDSKNARRLQDSSEDVTEVVLSELPQPRIVLTWTNVEEVVEVVEEEDHPATTSHP